MLVLALVSLGIPVPSRGLDPASRSIGYENANPCYPADDYCQAVPLGKRKSAGHRKVPDPNAAAVGQRIRRLRMERELTFDAFVEETGLGRGYVSELERGLVLPNVNVIRRVADVLDLTMADLVLGSSPREKLFEATLGLDAEALERILAAVTAHEPGGGGKAGAKGRGKK